MMGFRFRLDGYPLPELKALELPGESTSLYIYKVHMHPNSVDASLDPDEHTD